MSKAAADFPAITPAEQTRRRNAVRRAEASARLEGATTHPARTQLNNDYIAGHIDLDTYLARGRVVAHQAARAVPARAGRTR
jgi:Antitoxin VbhA